MAYEFTFEQTDVYRLAVGVARDLVDFHGGAARQQELRRIGAMLHRLQRR